MPRTPIPNCPQPETPIRERAWTDGQRLARVRELAELWKAGDFEERECAEKLLAILDADGGGADDQGNRTLSQDLRKEAMLIAGNGLTRKRDRQRVANLMLRCADWMAGAEADAARMDWLADPTNAVGNVQLPRACVERNPHSLRAAIDDAMKLPAPSNNQGNAPRDAA